MPLIAQYAGVGEACPQFQVQTTSGGNLASGSLYFSFQLQNRAGFNKPSVSGAIAYSANQKITITIPALIRKDGWDIHYFVISAGTTNDPATHVQIARIPNFQFGAGIDPQSVQINLPFILELTRDEHLLLAPSVVDLNNFPVGNNRLDGQVRWVTSESKWYEYRADSRLPFSVDVISADIGQWVRIGGPSTYVSSTRLGVGSDRPIRSINPSTTIPTPPYPGNTQGKYLPPWEAKYWIYNNNTNALPAGTEFGIELEYNNKRSPNLLNGLYMVKFIGFVGSDGTVRITDNEGREFKNCGAYFLWTPKLTTPFVTSDDLQPGEAIALAVKPFFAPSELDDGASSVTPKSLAGIYPVTRTQSGDFNPLGPIVSGGSTVFDIDDRYRVVPNTGLSFDVLAGAVMVKSYSFPAKPRRTFGGLLPNAAGQKIIINGNAAVYAENAAYAPTASEAIRAIVSTESGETVAGEWSEYQAIASGQSVQLTLNYPNAVRADYPDVIAGNTKAVFNPARVNVYLQRQDTGEIRRFSGFLVVAGTSQTFTLTSWTSGTIVLGLPAAADDFGLFAPGGVAIATSSGGTFPTTSYRAAYSFVYDGNQISKISHASPPCINEWDGPFSPVTVAVDPIIDLLPEGATPTVANTGTVSEVKLKFSFPPIGGGSANFDGILVDSSGQVLVDSNGNVLSINVDSNPASDQSDLSFVQIFSDYEALIEDDFIAVDCSLGNVVVTLPSAIFTGNIYEIKKVDNSVNTVTITPINSQTIDDAASFTIDTYNQSLSIIASGRKWLIF